jgi:hypothetical protein
MNEKRAAIPSKINRIKKPTVGFLVFAFWRKIVAMMEYKTGNQRDARDGGRDENPRHGSIREIRAIRGSLSELDHGVQAAWPRLISVVPSRAQSHSVANETDNPTEANEANEVELPRSEPGPRRIPFVTFVTFCSNHFRPATLCAVFTHFRQTSLARVKPIAPQSQSVAPSRTQSNQSGSRRTRTTQERPVVRAAQPSRSNPVKPSCVTC